MHYTDRNCDTYNVFVGLLWESKWLKRRRFIQLKMDKINFLQQNTQKNYKNQD